MTNKTQNASERAETSPLLDLIRRQIRATGPLSVTDYMTLCLSHPRYGYYITRDPLGKKGDFTTAPEVSQLFGELIGIWLILAIDNTRVSQNLIHLVELGPGRGTLMRDILRTIHQLRPALCPRLSIHLVETSPVLRDIQAETLKNLPFETAQHPHWHESIDSLPATGPLFIVANEFFDALPIRQFVFASGDWQERCVGLDPEGKLIYAARPTRLDPAILKDLPQPEEGSILEHTPLSDAIADSLSRRIKTQGGAALFVDYGYIKPAYGDTFQALANHAYADPLARPGCADLTTHVNFAALADQSTRASLTCHGPVTQADFLLTMGLLERAGQLGHGKEREEQMRISQDVERLAADNQMGQLFKVLAVSQTGATLPGFQTPL